MSVILGMSEKAEFMHTTTVVTLISHVCTPFRVVPCPINEELHSLGSVGFFDESCFQLCTENNHRRVLRVLGSWGNWICPDYRKPQKTHNKALWSGMSCSLIVELNW